MNRGPVWTNWSGGVSCRPASVAAPRDLDELVAAVRGAPGHVRVAGSGHSFTPLVATDETLLDLHALAGIEAVDAERRRVTVRAGTTLRALGPALLAHGLALENMGDVDAQTLAGAVSTGTHGTGAAFGCLSTQVVALTLVTADGAVLDASEDERPDVFAAARVSLGALGVLARVVLRAVPAGTLKVTKRPARLPEVLEGLEALRSGHRHFEFFWFPYTATVQVKTIDPTDEPPRPRPVAEWIDAVLLENAAFGLLCRACRAWPALSPRACRLAASALRTGTSVGPSHRVFPTVRLVRFEEMEYALPADAVRSALGELQRHLERHRPPVCFPVEVRFVKGDDIPLSPFQGRESACIAVHAYRGMEHAAYFAAAEAIFRAHAGRPHWGKRHGRAAADLAPVYPRWSDFQRVRSRLDPRGVFTTPYLEQVLGPPA